MVRYRSGGTPWTVIIDPEGKVVYNHFHIESHNAVGLIQNLLDGIPKQESESG